MFDKEKVIAFFDKCAPTWDDEMVKDDKIITTILDNADVHEGQDILDVACGTGVLVPDYQVRSIHSYTGIDISSKMIEIAKKKYASDSYQFICDDIMSHRFDQKFDRIIVYNAFPHFNNQEALIKTLTSLLKEDGIMTIAHSMSREAINKHHSGRAKEISQDLISIDELENLTKKYLNVICKISDDNMYQIGGRK